MGSNAGAKSVSQQVATPTELSATALLCGTALTQGTHAADLDVMNSGGFTAAYRLLAPKFEANSGDTLNIAYGLSMGNSLEAIPNRLARKEPEDVVIMVGYALDKLIAEGKVMPGSRVELADSRIGMAVRAGEPKPDISSAEAFKKTLLDAKSVAYSDSASGFYIKNQLFEKMGFEAQMEPKATVIPKIPVGAAHPSEARQLLDFLASPEAASDVASTGLDPLAAHQASP